jgi:hypothetical protein
LSIFYGHSVILWSSGIFLLFVLYQDKFGNPGLPA